MIRFALFLSFFLLPLSVFSQQTIQVIEPELPRGTVDLPIEDQPLPFQLPDENIPRSEILRLEDYAESLQSLIGTRQARGNTRAIAGPVSRLNRALERLPRKEVYTAAETTEVRRQAELLADRPITYVLLAQNQVLRGRSAFSEGNHMRAQRHFNRALGFLEGLRHTGDNPRLASAISRLESEVTIYRDATRREQHMDTFDDDDLFEEVQEAFYTYSDTPFNMWADLEYWQKSHAY